MAAVLDTRSAPSGVPAPESPFDSYTRLLRMLMPTLAGVVVHDAHTHLLWRSDEWDLAEYPELIRGALATTPGDPGHFGGVSAVLDADRTVYAFAVRGDGGEPLGVISLVARLARAQTEPRPLPTVRQLVQPALECLRRELSLQAQIGTREAHLGERERELTAREQHFESLLRTSLEQAGDADAGAGEFHRILKIALEQVGCALAALWVPDKNLFISLTRSGQPLSPESLQRAQQHLMAWMRLQQRTLVINHVSKVASDVSAPYKILACPVRHRSDRVMGVLALFNPPSAGDFDAHQTRVAELLAGKATGVIRSSYDAGTGLFTREAFEQQAAARLAAAPAAAHSVLYLDIDRLNEVNETFGMHVGDAVIAGVADCVAQASPPSALAARIAGDRLAVFLSDADGEGAARIAERIRAAAEQVRPVAGQGRAQVSVSIGVAPVATADHALAHALATAEFACKTAKDRGGNRVEACHDADERATRQKAEKLMIGRLRDALDQGSFRLDAQPILPLRGNYGHPRFELLIRMQGERGEVIPPGKFLAAAQRHQLMPAVDRWVVGRACDLLVAQGRAVSAEVARFCINLSGQSLRNDEFLPFVVERIRACGLSPSLLCFEITEAAAMDDLAQAQKFMRALRDLGCQFALDDFGAGVSSLAHLRDLSPDYLKIDGGFVRDANENPRSQSMIKAIEQLAKVMRMETIAEHVETDELRVRMADLGVDYGQGFAIGRAQPLEELLRELAVYEASVSSWARPA